MTATGWVKDDADAYARGLELQDQLEKYLGSPDMVISMIEGQGFGLLAAPKEGPE